MVKFNASMTSEQTTHTEMMKTDSELPAFGRWVHQAGSDVTLRVFSAVTDKVTIEED